MNKSQETILNIARENLTSEQIDEVIEKLEDLSIDTAEYEMTEEEKNWEPDPYEEVARENCRAFSDNIL